MNSLNAALQTAATALAAFGVATIQTDFWKGIIAIAIAFGVYVVYEVIPSKSQA